MKMVLQFLSFLTAFVSVSTAAYASFEALPGDLVITKIFASAQTNLSDENEPALSIKDLGRCARVCRKWRLLSSDQRVWHLHYTRYFALSIIPEDIYLASATFTSLNTLGDKKRILESNQSIIQELRSYFLELDTRLFSPEILKEEHRIIHEIIELISLPTKQLMKPFSESNRLYKARQSVFLALVIDRLHKPVFFKSWLSNIRAYDFHTSKSGCYLKIRSFLISRDSKSAIEEADKFPEDE